MLFGDYVADAVKLVTTLPHHLLTHSRDIKLIKIQIVMKKNTTI